MFWDALRGHKDACGQRGNRRRRRRQGVQWAVWATGVYAFIKSISGLVAVFQTLKTLAGAVSFAGIFKAAGPVAAALGLVAVAIGSVTTEQDSGEDIGRRYASVTSDIAAALKKQAQAANDAKASTDQLSESQKKLSASQAIEDQARALQEMQSLATGKGWLEMLGLGGESDEAVEKIKEKTIELLTAIRTGQGTSRNLSLRSISSERRPTARQSSRLPSSNGSPKPKRPERRRVENSLSSSTPGEAAY